jgi:hypothetical protein
VSSPRRIPVEPPAPCKAPRAGRVTKRRPARAQVTVSSRIAAFEAEWAQEIRAQGRDPFEVFPVATAKANRLAKGRTGAVALREAAAAWERARKLGWARYLPIPVPDADGTPGVTALRATAPY